MIADIGHPPDVPISSGGAERTSNRSAGHESVLRSKPPRERTVLPVEPAMGRDRHPLISVLP